MHIRGGGGSEEHDRPFEIIGRTPSSGRDPRQDFAAARRIIAQCLRVVRDHVTGRNCIHVDAERCQLIGHGTRQTEQAALRCRVRGDTDTALKRQHRGDIDDASSALSFDEPARERATEREHGAKIHLDHGVPIGVCVLENGRAADDSRVVDQDVRAANTVENHLRRGPIGQVRGNGDGTASEALDP